MGFWAKRTSYMSQSLEGSHIVGPGQLPSNLLLHEVATACPASLTGVQESDIHLHTRNY